VGHCDGPAMGHARRTHRGGVRGGVRQGSAAGVGQRRRHGETLEFSCGQQRVWRLSAWRATMARQPVTSCDGGPPWREHLTRRECLRLGGLVAAGAAAGWTDLRRAGAAATGEPASRLGQARSCILIYLLGGPPHLDMWDLKPGAPAEIRGPFRPIATSVPGLQVCEHLPVLAQRGQRFALVRSVSHANHNHTPMIYYTLTGREVERPNEDNDVRPPQRADFPHVGAVVAKFRPAPPGLPGFVAVPELAVRSSTSGEFKRTRQALRGGGGGFLGPLFDSLMVNGEPGTPAAIPDLQAPVEVTEEPLARRGAPRGGLAYLPRGAPAPTPHKP